MGHSESKYQQIVAWVKEKIDNGTFQSGDKLISENELAELFDTSRQTVRHATGVLVEQQLVTRIQGSGTYIGGKFRPVRKEKYKNVAVVSTFYESYIFPPTLKGIERELFKAGYSMQVFFTDNKIHREREILESILEKDNIDGLIVEAVKSVLPNPNLSYYKKLQERNIPILCFNTFYPGLSLPCVRIDDSAAAKRAVNLLIDAGHENIGGIFKSDDGQGPLRYAGFMEGVMDAGIKVTQEHVVWIDTLMTLNLSEIEDHLRKRLEGCTGVVCYNDQVAFQLIELVEKWGMRVPEDLSVVGIDDSSVATSGKVHFTSIPHPKELLGRKVGENMVAMIENPQFDGNYMYDMEPVIRKSVCKR
ncbi:MAG: GntR family transcriptional regulator [Eubacteriales bacterium]|nr:GntR family transcriptional regulator [Eubacteriales bacterium]